MRIKPVDALSRAKRLTDLGIKGQTCQVLAQSFQGFSFQGAELRVGRHLALNGNIH
jgi:hypothetical protein